ncbi:MAG: molybdopterin-binding oxidoreductase [Planctomycetaceae bacterium]|nr:MAG: molybdopterin-binding oxidoreductase [Planctomycetaceae bacterium]
MVPEEPEKYQWGEPPRPEHCSPEVIISPDTRRPQRLPPGQTRTRKWPVLQYGRIPVISREAWRLQITGLVRQPFTLTWETYRQLPRVKVFADFHCVTRWSRLGNLWEGVALRTVLERASVLPEARYLIAGGYDDGWTTNLPLEAALQEDVLLADLHDGQPLSAEHGGPVRLVVPRLYAWKSAKWLSTLELLAEDRRGTWEAVGYHDRGDPWLEERMWK